jgi:tetratricopeptide (TPR) repeat protein
LRYGESLYLVFMRKAIRNFSAITVFTVCCAAAPVRADGVRDTNAGSRALESQNLDTAVFLLTRGIRSDDLSDEMLAIAYHHRGIAHQAQGDIARAILDYTNAMQRGSLPPDVRPRALNNRAICLEILGDLEAALRDLNRAIALKRDYADAFVNRASVLRKMAAYRDAVADYGRAQQFGYPRPLVIAHGLAQTYEAAGDRAPALRYYREALRHDPSFEVARERIAVLTAAGVRMAAQTGQVRAAPSAPDPFADAEAAVQPDPAGENFLRAAIVDSASGPITGAGFAIETPVLQDAPLRTGRGQIGFGGLSSSRGPKGGPETLSAPPALGRERVQLGSFAAAALAEQGWAVLRDRFPQDLSSLEAKIVEADHPRRGRVYRLTADVPAGQTAFALCAALKRRGQSCIPAVTR